MTKNTPPKTRILIADQNALFREGIAKICEAEPDLHVIGQVADGPGVIKFVQREIVDIVLLEIEMPGMTAEEIVEQITATSSSPQVAILTMQEDVPLIRKLLSVGVQAYISKTSTGEELLSSIRLMRLSRERAILTIPKNILDKLTQSGDDLLTVREQEVLNLVAKGLSNAEIAGNLYISEGTVKRHLTNIYLKLDVRSRVNAINKAIKIGIPGIHQSRRDGE
jgi:DNA-binding NarL/FixJ family response regulator